MALGDLARKLGQASKNTTQQAQRAQRAQKPAAVAGRVGNVAKRATQQRRPSQPSGLSRVAGTIGQAAQSFSGGGPEMSAQAMPMPEPAPVEPPPPPQLSEDEWRAQDSTFLGEQSALDLQLKQALAGLAESRTGYNKDFGSSLRNLGFGWQDANNDGLPDDAEIKGGAWNKNDMQGAYGQAYNNTTNDFASRGLMDSSLFADAMTEQDRGFTRQFDDMQGARQQYLKSLLGEETSAKDTQAQALAQARASASARRAAEYGL